MSDKTIAAQKLAINGQEFTTDEVTHAGTTKNRLLVNDVWQADNSDVSSIDTRVSAEEVAQASVETSMNTRVGDEETTQASAETSLTTRVSAEEVAQASVETSINTRLAAEEKTTQIATIDIASGAVSIDINYESDLSMDTPFANTPAVCANMRNTSADADIVLCMLAGESSATGCKFVFSDEISGGNYKLDIIVTD